MATAYGQTVDVYEDQEDSTITPLTETDTGGFLTLADATYHWEGTHAAKIDYTSLNANAFLNYDIISNSVSVGFAYRVLTGRSAWAFGPQIFQIKNDSLGNLIYINDTYSDTLHLSFQGSGLTTRDVVVTAGTWYWISLKFVRNGECRIAVYDAAHAEVQADMAMTGTAANYATNDVNIGCCTSDAISGQAYYDTILIDNTSAAHPLLGWATAAPVIITGDLEQAVALQKAPAISAIQSLFTQRKHVKMIF
jgi:hypothetical protein